MKTNLMEAREWRLCMTALLLIVESVASAHDFSSGGIYYNILSSTDRTCEVTNNNGRGGSYSGSITIPETVKYNNTTYIVTSIGSQAFSKCTGLTSVTISNSVTTIGDNAFQECTGLTEITIPNSVTSIGNYAFSLCEGLVQATIGGSVTEIGSYAFYLCTELKTLILEDGDQALSRTSSFYNCPIETLYLGRNIEGAYNSNVFGSKLTSITIGNSVTEIASSLFSYCINLTEVTIPSNVALIGSYAFDGCTGLASVTLEDGVKEIGQTAFSGCTGLTEVIIPNSVATIGSSAFYNCSGLKKLTIGSGIKNMGDYAFRLCTELTDLTLVDGVTCIGKYAFWSCTSLAKVSIPGSVSTIGSCAFYGCTALTDLIINDGVAEIEQMAFYVCDKLRGVDVPGSVAEIGDAAFWGCTAFGYLTLGEGVEKIGQGAFTYCSNLSEVTIPNSVTTIGNGAFQYCTNITVATVGSGITSMDYTVFFGCELEELYFFSRLDSYYYAFSYLFCDIYVYADQIESIQKYYSSGAVLPFEEVFAMSPAETYPRSFALEAATNASQLPEGTSIMRVEIDGEEITPDTSGSYIVYALLPNTSYVCALYFTLNGEEFVNETTIETADFCDTATLQSTTSSSVSFQITLSEDPYSGLPDEYGIAIGTNYYPADKDGVATADGLLANTEYGFELYAKYSGTVVIGATLTATTQEDTDGVSGIMVNGQAEVEGYFTTDGKKVSQPQRGIYIIHYSDGTAKKVLVK